MKYWLINMVVGICLSSQSAFAEVYKYYDSEGSLRFTDNFLEVPVDQRPELLPQVDLPVTTKSAETEDDTAATPSSNGNNDAVTISSDFSRNPSRAIGDTTEPDNLIDQIKARQIELHAEYRELVAERARLESRRESWKTVEDVVNFNRESSELNQRIEVYNTKQAELQKQMQAYADVINEYNETVNSLSGTVQKENASTLNAQ